MIAALHILAACLLMLLLMGLAATGLYAVPIAFLWRVWRAGR